MQARTSTARVEWEGPLIDGSGTLTTQSNVLDDVPVRWAARVEQAQGTNPEELIAGAHATCYAMSLANLLATQGHPARHLDVSATCTLDKLPGGGILISQMQLGVVARVPDLDEQTFEQIAAQAKDDSPVSRALHGNVNVLVRAHLQGIVTTR